MEINSKDQNIERLENEKQDLANEKRTLELQFHQTRLELTALKETFQDQKIKADLATDELNIFKKKWQERELCQQNSFDSSQQIINDLQHQLQRKTEDLESMSIKHANLLISMKETKENERNELILRQGAFSFKVDLFCKIGCYLLCCIYNTYITYVKNRKWL